MLASTATPDTAAIALKLLEAYEADVALKTNDAFADLLVAKDSKGKSKLLVDLMKKAHAGSACAALIDKLCTENERVRQAIVSPEMFDTLARPGTGVIAHGLVADKGLGGPAELVALLLADKDEKGAGYVEEQVDGLLRFYPF